MRLIVSACTLAVISLVVLYRFVIITEQIIAHLIPTAAQPSPQPPQPTGLAKYFNEPGEPLLSHYDTRFYRGIRVSNEERMDTLHHMIRAYLTTFSDLHVETWIAHGTLLGWWWNERILPWDTDLDTQVSAQALAYMGEFLNQSSHTYRSGDVERDYFLDVNPYYKERTRGDGSNIIDARWIDVRNGLFIDITGISEVDRMSPGVWSCKNQHRYNTEDIWPLRMSYFEGSQAMVPNAYYKVLLEEYGAKSLNLTEYEGHRWDGKLRRWVIKPVVPA